MEEEFLGALYKGGELLASGKIVEAREHLEKAHGLAPKNEKAQNLLGLTYFKLGLFDQASEVYERLVNENPTDATLRVNLGLVYLKTNNLERCIKEFETATDLEPTHKKAHNYLGLALAQQGTYAKAKDHFVLAGSEQMAEKMGRALAAQSSPSGFHAPVDRQAPRNVVIGEEAGASPPPREEEPIEVMSDEELPSDAYVVPEEVAVALLPSSPGLTSDWGAQLKPAPPAEDAAELRFAEDEGPSAASLETPVEELPVLDAVVESMPLEAVPPPAGEGSGATPAWLTMEAAEAQRAPAATAWVTETVRDVPLPPEPTQTSPTPEAPLGATDARWAEAAPAANDASWATEEAPAPEASAQPEEPTEWVTQEAPVSQQDASAETLAQPEATTEWVTQEAPAAEPTQEYPAPAEASRAEQSPAPEEAGEPLPTTPDDASWATGPTERQWATEQVAELAPPEPEAEQWVASGPETGPIEPLPEPVVEAIFPPAPSAPLHITVEEPQEAPAPVAAPAGYTPMSPQRLVDLGASGAWVQEPSAGPFHLSSDGLAVTVDGEMMVRMTGLVAIVGSLEVKPENRRRRGRSSAEPFGTGPAQLQRVTGHGVLYLEPGRSKFHAVDLTDQNGVSIDDDGAYLREEMVFAFEEAISFENGRLTAEGQTLELAHLKGNGRVLLQLDGTLRALPIPLGAPMVIPLHRIVGWFGRVSPRLMGFGGRGAVELTGEGYALLGTPAEGR